MLSPLLLDDEPAAQPAAPAPPTNGNGSVSADPSIPPVFGQTPEATASAPEDGDTGPVSDARRLRGLLEDGPLTPGGGLAAGPRRFATEEMLEGDSTRALPLGEAHIDDILRLSQQMKGSDIHLTVGLPPMVRIDGKLVQTRYEVVTPREGQRLVYDILSTEQIEKYERTKELDFSYGVASIGRFRFNVYRQRGSIGCAMRAIPAKIPSLDQLRLPPILRELTKKHSGMILVTGPTGSGKSTTIASMIDVINSERPVHIMTMEDPVEYLHVHKTGMINQREIGQDTDSFGNAIRAVLREDPDVILVGEMRDKETIAAALTLSETGHLVFGTLHTRSAPSTVDRIVDVFPPDQQDQIKVQLANSLQAVIAQQLMPQLGGGRVAALEIMVATSAIRNLIREGKTYQIMSSIETGSQHGMQPMDKILSDLHKAGMVSYEEALIRAIDRDNFIRLVRGA